MKTELATIGTGILESRSGTFRRLVAAKTRTSIRMFRSKAG
jgi:hypothetical protein